VDELSKDQLLELEKIMVDVWRENLAISRAPPRLSEERRHLCGYAVTEYEQNVFLPRSSALLQLENIPKVGATNLDANLRYC